MTFQTGVTEFAEFVGSEIKRIEKKIPTDGGSSQSSDSPIITGNGRPDKPDTTGDVLNGVENKIKGNEPNGTIYRSINGAGVGAYLWQKQNNKWVVISGDTGARRIQWNVLLVKGAGIPFHFTEAVILNSQGKTTPNEWIFYLIQKYHPASVLAFLLCFRFIVMTVITLQRCMLVVEQTAIILSCVSKINCLRTTLIICVCLLSVG